MFNLKQFTLVLGLLFILSLFKIIKQNSKESVLEQTILDLKSKFSIFEELQLKTLKISTKLEKTESQLNTCQQNNEHLNKKLRKTRETLDASIRSLKSSNSKKDTCVKETSSILIDKENIVKEKQELSDKVQSLEVKLASRTTRAEELANRLETIRLQNNKERAIQDKKEEKPGKEEKIH
jgi:hypothetical protein